MMKAIFEGMIFLSCLIMIYIFMMSACALVDKCYCYYKGDKLCQKLN
jgi:uncharacterized protein YqhQ